MYVPKASLLIEAVIELNIKFEAIDPKLKISVTQNSGSNSSSNNTSFNRSKLIGIITYGDKNLDSFKLIV